MIQKQLVSTISKIFLEFERAHYHVPAVVFHPVYLYNPPPTAAHTLFGRFSLHKKHPRHTVFISVSGEFHNVHSSSVIQFIPLYCFSCLSLVKNTSQPVSAATASCNESIALKSWYSARIFAAVSAILAEIAIN